MIRNPNDIQDGAKKIRMLIAGYPRHRQVYAGPVRTPSASHRL